MPYCVVNNCTNNSTKHKKSQGITFHLFPTDTEVKNKWIAAIRFTRNDPVWYPSKHQVVCSVHFEESDIYTTEGGLRRVTKYGYPKKMLTPKCEINANNSVMPNMFANHFQDVPDFRDLKFHTSQLPTTSLIGIQDYLRGPIDYTEKLNTPPAIIPDFTGEPTGYTEKPNTPSAILPDFTGDPTGYTEKPNTPSAILPDFPGEPIDYTEKPNTPSAIVPDFPGEPADYTEKPSTSAPFLPELAVLPISVLAGGNQLPELSQAPMYNLPARMKTTNKKVSALDSPLRRKLEQLLNRSTKMLKNKTKKIKLLVQKFKRLQKINKSLKNKVRTLKNKNDLSPDLSNSLNEEIVIMDLINILNRKKNNRIKYTLAVKKFCITLNFHSPKAYEYVRHSLNACLPHPKTLSKWHGCLKGELGNTEEAFQDLKESSMATDHGLDDNLMTISA